MEIMQCEMIGFGLAEREREGEGEGGVLYVSWTFDMPACRFNMIYQNPQQQELWIKQTDRFPLYRLTDFIIRGGVKLSGGGGLGRCDRAANVKSHKNHYLVLIRGTSSPHTNKQSCVSIFEGWERYIYMCT